MLRCGPHCPRQDSSSQHPVRDAYAAGAGGRIPVRHAPAMASIEQGAPSTSWPRVPPGLRIGAGLRSGYRLRNWVSQVSQPSAGELAVGRTLAHNRCSDHGPRHPWLTRGPGNPSDPLTGRYWECSQVVQMGRRALGCRSCLFGDSERPRACVPIGPAAVATAPATMLRRAACNCRWNSFMQP